MKLALREVTYLHKVSAMAYYASRFRSITSVWFQRAWLYPQSYNCLHFEFLTQILNFVFLSGRLSKEKKKKTHGNWALIQVKFALQILFSRSKSPTLFVTHFCPCISFLFILNNNMFKAKLSAWIVISILFFGSLFQWCW